VVTLEDKEEKKVRVVYRGERARVLIQKGRGERGVQTWEEEA